MLTFKQRRERHLQKKYQELAASLNKTKQTGKEIVILADDKKGICTPEQWTQVRPYLEEDVIPVVWLSHNVVTAVIAGTNVAAVWRAAYICFVEVSGASPYDPELQKVLSSIRENMERDFNVKLDPEPYKSKSVH